MKKLIKSQLVDRLNPKTTAIIPRKIRNIFAIVALLGGAILVAPVDMGAGIIAWVTWITSLSGAIAGTAHLNKGRK